MLDEIVLIFIFNMENNKHPLAHKISEITKWILIVAIILIVMFLLWNSYASRKWFDSKNDMIKCHAKTVEILRQGSLLENEWYASELYKQCDDDQWSMKECMVGWVLQKHPELCKEYDTESIGRFINKK